MASAGQPSDHHVRQVLIVVGAGLDAERFDRPLAYRLRERMLRWMDRQKGDHHDGAIQLEPLVCTDLWYLNDASIQDKPVVALGDPAANAAVAALATRLPSAFIIDHTLRVHLDAEFIDLKACFWGASSGATASAADVFVERYLDEFLQEVVSR